MKQRKSTKSTLPSSNRKVFSLSLIGAGLIFIGVAAFFLLSQTDGGVSADTLVVQPAELNHAAPDLTLRDLEGKLVSLTDYRGQVILVNNWATWCPPCRAEMPVLEAYYQANRQKGFVILAIEAGDPVEEVRAFVRQYGLSFPVLLDPEGHSLAAFNNPALPNTYIIDRQGRVRLAWTGAVNQKALETFLTPLLKE
jgi:peroxiredoxin